MRSALAVSLLLVGAPLAHADASLATLEHDYLEGLFRAKPHLATFMGDHRFDDRIVDLSPAALAARERELVALETQLGDWRRVRGTRSLDEEVDAAILRDGIRLELLYLREIRDWSWDPRLDDSFPYYDPRELVAGRLSDIIHGEFAPEAARLKSVLGELLALPRFLEQKRAALGPWSKIHLAQAIKDNQGRIEFFESEVKAFTAKNPAAEAARQTAVQSLVSYQKFLTAADPSRATRDWRLGAALYSKKFPLALQTSLEPKQTVERAQTAFSAARADLYRIACGLHRELWPHDPEPSPVAGADAQKRVIERVKEELSKDHPKPGELVLAHAKKLDALRAFIEHHDLLELPPRETLRVEPMPAFKRGSSAAEYLAPGALERRPSWHATYYVDPIDPTWPADRVESYLRGQNDYEVELVAAHEAYPGHHTQYFYSKRNLNPLRAVLWNAPMVEGWAVYGEGLLVALGWGDRKNPRFRFYDARGRMIVAANAILDVKLQSGEMSDDQAVRFMVEEGFQERAMAEKKLLRAKLDSTQLAQYFLGLEEIRALEGDQRQRAGERFNQRSFDEALIGHGSIAVQFLRRYLAQ